MFEFIDVKYKNILNIPKLEIGEENVTCLVGESGGGKTTILKLLNKMLSPTEGVILYNGLNLDKIESVKHRREIVMLSQNPAIFEGDIRNNLIIGLKFHEAKIPSDVSLYEILEKVKLKKKLDDLPNFLSGGEKQRLALGRILLLDPKIYLFDEPSAALDSETEKFIIEMLIEVGRVGNKKIVMVTHSSEIAKKYSDKLIEISTGNIISERYIYE
ncbi:MAG: ATP-binding cassette domain-containing protein [Vulcanibacillus sp.]